MFKPSLGWASPLSGFLPPWQPELGFKMAKYLFITNKPDPDGLAIDLIPEQSEAAKFNNLAPKLRPYFSKILMNYEPCEIWTF